MFNLEQSVAEWRQQMLATGIKSPVPLEELEIHLREEIHRRISSGLNEADAFSSAVQNIGQAQLVQNEFAKISMRGISMPADCKIFRLKAEPIFYFFFVFSWLVAFGLILRDDGLNFNRLALVVSSASGVVFSYAVAKICHRAFALGVSADGIYVRRRRERMDVVRWPDIKRVRPCRMFNLRWLLIYTTPGRKIWVPLFLPKSQEVELWREIHRLEPQIVSQLLPAKTA
jgi:hypothetical protein